MYVILKMGHFKKFEDKKSGHFKEKTRDFHFQTTVGSQWNDATSARECDVGYLATPFVSWRKNQLCIACTGIGAKGKVIYEN